MLGLVFALPIEMAPLKAELVGARCNVPLQKWSPAPKEFYSGYLGGTPVVLTAAGIGPERAERATKGLLERFKIEAVLSVGYTGALRDGIRTGELVIVRNVLSRSPINQTPARYPCHPLLTELSQKVAEENGFKVHLGDILTVTEPIKRPEDKRQAGVLTGAVAVDMEGAGVATVAREARIPFMALKVILDEVDEELKGTGLVDGEGRADFFKAFTYLLYNPWDIIYLLRLNRQAVRAASELARFLSVMVREIGEQVTGDR
ncbi:MAG TPA: phosphorylase family protein [Candidatus Tripitaka californicus]|uniref:phosphorylase family protein n=1 Tax=Candidatus Tripitaka californicus TaxID=3367616 RepID=UPI0040256F95